MSVFAKLQPVFIIFSGLLGVLLGKTSDTIEKNASGFIEICLMLMLFFVFLGVDLFRNPGRFFRANRAFSVSAFAINFLWTPLFAFLLAKTFFPGQTSLQTGFIMLLVTPCTDWYLIFTGLANGNVALGASILPLNLILQIVLLPVYLSLFMGKTLALDPQTIARGIGIVLIVPLLSASLARGIIRQQRKKKAALPFGTGAWFNRIMARNDDIQFALLCLAIVSMFASQGSVLLANLIVFTKLLVPLILFFAVNFLVSLFTGRNRRLPFPDIVPLIFTTSARNSPVSLAIAVFTFPADPVISLVLVTGPLIELPVLALEAVILKKAARRADPGVIVPVGKNAV
jgi:ACR3 family arsenite efflux pump ArsB